MVTKYFRFNMSDDNKDTHWGYATGNGEYSSENVSLDKIPYDEATGIIRSWLKNCGAITNTLEIDNAVASAFSKGSTSVVFHYDNGEKYRMTIETADNPVTEWEDFERLDEAWKKAKSKSLKESNAPKITFKTIEDALYQWYIYQLDFNSNFSDERTKEAYDDIFDIIKASSTPSFGLINEIIHKIEWYGYDSWQFKKNIYGLINESKNIKNNRFNESLHNNDDNINNLISKIEVYKDIVSNRTYKKDILDFDAVSEKLHESIQGTVGDFCRLKGIDTDQFVEFLQTNFDWARHCEAWTIVDFDCLERCFSKLDEATVAQAKRFASRKHGETGAVRKATGQPYIVHPEGVAALVKENGGDDEQIQAAWLHDTIEDTGATYDDIVEKFGKRVADIVSEVTNKPHLKKSEKEAYMTNKLKNLSHDALLVKLCDMRYNYYDYAPIEQRMRIEKNIKELMSSRELTKEEWQLCEEILDWDNTVEGLDENAINKTLRLSSLNA